MTSAAVRGCLVAIFLVAVSVACAAQDATSFTVNDAIAGNTPRVYFRGKPVPLPALEVVLGQDFDVSVMSETYGVFNATLRVRSSLTFPERLHGELIPHGDATDAVTPLPHFQRLRTTADDRYSEIPLVADVLPKVHERPTLLVFDMLLQHSNSPQGSLSVYYLPADETALERTQEALQEGSLSADAVASFFFKDERPTMATPPLRAVAPLARTTSGVFARFAPGTTAKAVEDEADSEAAANPSAHGDFVFRLLSEHEFWCQLRIPAVPSADGTAPSVPPENVWMYGYTQPSKAVLNREQERPWYSKYSVFFLGGMAFVIQIISGITDGWKKSNAAAEAREQAALGTAPPPQAVKQGKKKH